MEDIKKEFYKKFTEHSIRNGINGDIIWNYEVAIIKAVWDWVATKLEEERKKGYDKGQKDWENKMAKRLARANDSLEVKQPIKEKKDNPHDHTKLMGVYLSDVIGTEKHCIRCGIDEKDVRKGAGECNVQGRYYGNHSYRR